MMLQNGKNTLRYWTWFKLNLRQRDSYNKIFTFSCNIKNYHNLGLKNHSGLKYAQNILTERHFNLLKDNSHCLQHHNLSRQVFHSLSNNKRCLNILNKFSTAVSCSMSSVDKDNVSSTPEAAVRWQLQQKEYQLREAKDDILEGIQETKAKVKERMEDIIERENIWTIPNFLCIGRMLASPVLLWMVVNSSYSAGLALFVCAGFTDLLDGTIARVIPGQASRLGSFLDPLADKILVAALFFGLTYQGLIPLPLTGLIIYRDLLIIGGASYVRYTSLPPPKTISRYFDATHATAQLAPTTISKVNTMIQLSLITAALAAPIYHYEEHILYHSLIAVTAISTLASGISYIFSNNTYKYIKKIKEEEGDKEQ